MGGAQQQRIWQRASLDGFWQFVHCVKKDWRVDSRLSATESPPMHDQDKLATRSLMVLLPL
ncbi:hypothetical protein ASC92_17825 [Variovorax sp. Root411]|nr:hypothetical protein ASC92_17825 [Variovorax sp. Root411]